MIILKLIFVHLFLSLCVFYAQITTISLKRNEKIQKREKKWGSTKNNILLTLRSNEDQYYF